MKRVFRIASPILPMVAAGAAALAAPDGLARTAALVLWPLAALALAALLGGAALRAREPRGRLLDRLDVLTGTGRALAWSGAGAIAAAVVVGWASLAVVGMFGLGVVYLMMLWTALAAGQGGWWQRGEVARSLVPELAVEGDPVREEVRLRGIRIPAGYRLLATGRVGRGWPLSRYAVSADESGGEVLLESDLGAARRGEHEAPPLQLWLEDVFGLCRTPAVRLGPARQVVLPRPGMVDGAKQLVGAGGHQADAVTTRRLPTEGVFRLREYVPGDDARRIHWVRSLAARQLIVRQPDELPRDRPAVRLVLDNFLPGADVLESDAPAELLDQMVRVWLGVGKALAQAGARVTLATAVRRGSGLAVEERPLAKRSEREGLRLGARAAWQGTLRTQSMLQPGSSMQVVVSCRPQPVGPAGEEVRWVVVPERLWATSEPFFLLRDSPLCLPHPTGSPENRWSRRRALERSREARRRDRQLFDDLCWLGGASSGRLRGQLMARPAASSRIRLEAIP